MTADHERAALLRARAERWRDERVIDAAQEREIVGHFDQPWRTHGLLVQAVFFVLTCVAQAALYALLDTFDVPKPGLVLGVGAIAMAEHLIRRRRWFGTGVEAALWLGAMFALISELPRSGTPESSLVIAAAVAIAAYRVRNPFFGAGVAGVLVYYAEDRFDAGVVAALGFGALAMLALLRTWRRPSAETLWTCVAIILPLAGRLAADPYWIALTIPLYAVYGLVALFLGVTRRHHALLLAAAAGLGIAAFDFANRIALPPEAKLTVGGLVLLLTSWGVSRALRERTAGLVVTQEKLTTLDDALEIAGALATAHATRADPPVDGGRPEGGGGFGGAGATGEY